MSAQRKSKTATAKREALRKRTAAMTPLERMAYALYLGRRNRAIAEKLRGAS